VLISHDAVRARYLSCQTHGPGRALWEKAMIEERGGCSDRTDISFAFQTAFAAYSVPNKTDKFYDLAGSLGFISTTLVSLVRAAFVEL